MSRRSRRTTALLVLVFIVVPIAELFVLIQVGRAIGPWWTVLLLLLDSLLGSWLIGREGRRAWQALRERVEAGRLPAREVADGVLVVLGGALLLSPGFVTDVLGLLLIVPLTRPLFRRLVLSYASGRVVARTTGRTDPGNGTRPGPEVVRGEVIDDA